MLVARHGATGAQACFGAEYLSKYRSGITGLGVESVMQAYYSATGSRE
jgi:hypothetical protein